jgi:hypothetical protein
MLPVGMRKASITNARNKNARTKAVISHSNVFATSAAMSLRAVFFELSFCFEVEAINLILLLPGLVNAAEEAVIIRLSATNWRRNLLIMQRKLKLVNIRFRFERYFQAHQTIEGTARQHTERQTNSAG